MVEVVVRMLVKNRIIDFDDCELYQYGLNLLIKKILHVSMILIVGITCKKFVCTTAFLIAYAGIREYAGGYHAKTSKGCYLCTWGVTLFSVFLFYVFEQIKMLGLYVVLAACAVIILGLAPQETANRPLNTQELTVYRKKAQKCLIIEGVICLLFLFFKAILYGVLCAWIVETMMLLIGKISMKYQ